MSYMIEQIAYSQSCAGKGILALRALPYTKVGFYKEMLALELEHSVQEVKPVR